MNSGRSDFQEPGPHAGVLRYGYSRRLGIKQTKTKKHLQTVSGGTQAPVSPANPPACNPEGISRGEKDYNQAALKAAMSQHLRELDSEILREERGNKNGMWCCGGEIVEAARRLIKEEKKGKGKIDEIKLTQLNKKLKIA